VTNTTFFMIRNKIVKIICKGWNTTEYRIFKAIRKGYFKKAITIFDECEYVLKTELGGDIYDMFIKEMEIRSAISKAGV